ncbi:MAG TPA: hypothetical protein VIL71_22270 [Spirillospora sp.]
MRPPVCAICDRRLQDGHPFEKFELVRFGLDDHDEELLKAREHMGWAGHPEWSEWFCDEHAPLGEELSHLHWREARERLRTMWEEHDPPS